ncbi:MAG: NifU family protein [Fusobacterium gastrosuis]|uniref:NifU family protein n=1 Tax=Fusobacterium TaxID=848 RepID=UPI001F4F7E78|nr:MULTISPECIES: NifU family protein [Fusobacterium]MDD7392268.1 NifU family protein [Fusobacteriaceae bacterium]MCI5725491.1 NifU family protein [Fusobacterium sp.]MCI7223616.1 NifU family protein [Fusobacterium sp.]MDD7410629.1 NifU family protein [Fusobacteriaceae bacterium]MDY4010377.1 NifU family protein [Fusobacterium gastrosuis]
MDKIKNFISESINPILEEHGGGVELLEYNMEKQSLNLRVYGQCCSCPHSIDTNENFIKANIFKKFPEIQNIYIENGLSEDLWNIAKNILRRENKK